MTTLRSVLGPVRAHRQLEGGGFPVRRPFPSRQVDVIDPFLLLDEMGPVDWAPGKAIGAPDHPHRGFETVTYILEGGVQHRDSQGHEGLIGPGGVQWMTAGSGIVHSEMPPEAILRDGGRVHGFQLWVNLPRTHKMMHPRYQERSADEIPVGRAEDGLSEVRVIAGEALQTSARINTEISIAYHHWLVRPGGHMETTIAETQNCFLYLFRGAGTFGAAHHHATEGEMVIWQRDGDTVSAHCDEAADENLEFLLIAGAPLNEPIARYGPFVMNTRKEIVDAVHDFQSGKMGHIKAHND